MSAALRTLRAGIALSIVVAGAGCEAILGIDDTSLEPDAGSPDGAPDAPPLAVDVGTGADGPRSIAATQYTDDVRTGLVATVGAGSTLAEVASTTGFAEGDEVVIMQMTGANAGIYETHRLGAVGATSLTLLPALAAQYEASAGGVSQIIRVPNYTTVMIPGAPGRLTAHSWDGATGGVVFFRATGTVTIASGGVITAVRLGGAGGEAGTGSPGGALGLGGGGGTRVNCPLLGCGTMTFGGGGGAGEFDPGNIGEGGGNSQMCHGGPGGRGGFGGFASVVAVPGELGGGPGGGAIGSAAGVNLSPSLARPMLGGGGAGGDGGNGGRGGGGGGGGGGPVAQGAGASSGAPGSPGEPGGNGGNGGDGGDGAGIVIIHAAAIISDGVIDARGIDSTSATDATDGGIGGGAGGPGGAPLCNGAFIVGGRGGGGTGAGGGTGGGGGGGGAGGVIVLNATTMQLTGSVRATGGAGSTAGLGGAAGLGGDGFGGIAPMGTPGLDGAPGAAGNPGFIYLHYVETCDGCAGASDPPAVVIGP